METKQPGRLREEVDYQESPPPYDDTFATATTISAADPPTAQYYSQQIQSHLSTLSAQIDSLKFQKSLLSDAQDEKILSLLTVQIQLYLSAFAKSGLSRGTLVLIPAKGVKEEQAVLADFEDKKKDGGLEYDQVIKVRDKDGSSDDGDLWFWNNEDMAKRLASFLQPQPSLKEKVLPPRKEESEPAVAQSTSRTFWRRKKSSTTTTPATENETGNAVPVSEPRKTLQEGATMKITAEEVCFRIENDFGIFESKRGWGLVLRLKMVQPKR